VDWPPERSGRGGAAGEEVVIIGAALDAVVIGIMVGCKDCRGY
jgi:hypothetical protein